MNRLMPLVVLMLTFAGILTNCSDLPPGPGDEKPDTTSHSFTWETFTIGDGNNSVLYDVAIINDTLAYAVGAIYVKDSTGQFEPVPYNVARWNGLSWELLRIQFLTFCNQSTTNSYPARGVFAFGANNVWISSGSQVIRWNGQSQTVPVCIPVSVNKLWASSTNSLYAVGVGGGLAWFNGTTWLKLSSGTSTMINDVYGVWDGSRYQVYCAVTDFFQPGDKKILRISEGGNVDSVAWGLGRDVVSVWSADGGFLYACGDGVFENSQGAWQEIKFGAYTNRIRGSAKNRVFVVGDFGLIAHFNGSTWKAFYPEPSTSYNGVAVTDHLVVAVGRSAARATIVVGKQQIN